MAGVQTDCIVYQSWLLPKSMWRSEFTRVLNLCYQVSRSKDPKFSLRAMAKKLKVAPSTMSDLMKGEGSISFSRTLQILEILESEIQDAKELLVTLKKADLNLKMQLPESVYDVLIDWKARGVLVAAELGLKAKDTCRMLDLDEKAYSRIGQDLVSAGLLTLNSDGHMTPTQWATTDGPSNLSIRKMHESNLKCAALALAKVPTELRHFGSLTISGNPFQLENAKKLISEFYQKIERQFSLGPKTTIFQISTQVYPMNFGASHDES